MADAASGGAVATVVTGSALTLSGSILGLDYGTFLVGLAGAVFALTWLPRTPWLDRAVGVVVTAVFAGYVAPLAVLGAHTITALEWVPVQAQYFIALTFGYTGQGILLPKLRALLTKAADTGIDGVGK